MAVFTRPPSLVLFLLAASAGSVSGSTSLTVTSTHTLTTGTYNFDSLTVGDGATLTIEGAVEIYVGTATIIGTSPAPLPADDCRNLCGSSSVAVGRREVSLRRHCATKS